MQLGKDQPLVSIVIPCYNHEKYVQECIESVIAQDYENIELIIIDDGSKDESVSKIKELVPQCEKRFKRFEFRNRPNKGLCATLNEAVLWCQGEFYSVIASDDMMVASKTSLQIRSFCSDDDFENISAVFSGYNMVESNGKMINSITYKRESKIDFKGYYGRRWLCASTALIRMSFLRKVDGYDENLPYEDLDMWLKLLKNRSIFKVIPESLVSLRKHGSNMSGDKIFMFFSEMKVYWKHKNTIYYPFAVLSCLKNLVKKSLK